MDAHILIHERIEQAADSGVLDLSGLGLARVPEEVRGLRRLSWLDVSDNDLTELPAWLGNSPP